MNLHFKNKDGTVEDVTMNLHLINSDHELEAAYAYGFAIGGVSVVAVMLAVFIVWSLL